MEPKRFQLYKTNSQQMRFYLVFCIVMTVLGLAGLISELGFNYRIFNLQTSLFVMLAFQGAIGVYIARNNLDNNKYFVSWDENELNYHLPNNSEPVNIRLTEIRKIEREPQKIRIKRKTGEVKYFGFTYFYFPARTTILDFFEGIKSNMETEQKQVKDNGIIKKV
ncbi:MAG: hypothetical protein FD181_254 [Prolixibacteraceae bacterium]|nr:MAG: hypothetical protein FD181_254 [Prolixibacteraceae bacterium]